MCKNKLHYHASIKQPKTTFWKCDTVLTESMIIRNLEISLTDLKDLYNEGYRTLRHK